MHDVHVVLARARVRCVSSARVSVGCAHTHVYCRRLRYVYVEREEVGLRRSLVDGSLLLARTSFLEERAFPTNQPSGAAGPPSASTSPSAVGSSCSGALPSRAPHFPCTHGARRGAPPMADPRRPPQAKGTVRTRPLPSSSPAPSPPVTPTFASSLFPVLLIYIHCTNPYLSRMSCPGLRFIRTSR